MSVHLFTGSIAGNPAEPLLLEAVTVRLIEDSERERFDEELVTKHYLKNANAVGRVLRYVAEYRGQWVALLVFNSPALHLKLRDQWLHWPARQVKERRHLIAQNSRFLVLGAPGQWPNLASRVLKRVCERLAADWQEHFGYPVLVGESFRKQMTDPRDPHGVRHKLAGVLALIALAVAAGCKGPHAMAEFAQSLHHAQRGRLRCRPRKGRPREYDVPCERTFRRLLKQVDAQQLKAVLTAWMEAEDPAPLQVVPVDGKVVKNAQPAPARSTAQPAQAAAEPCEIPAELQKPKADKALMLVNFQTTEQRRVDQVAVPRDTNEEAAVAAHLPKMDLAGGCLTADAAHTIKANCRQLTQGNGAEFFPFLKANQPAALAKAEQLLPGTLPPQATTVDKDHGRIETRELWCVRTDPKTMGLAGVAQVARIHCHTQIVRRGKVIKETDDTRFAVTSYWPQEAAPDRLQELGRSHWSIENGQHYRRDRTQDEDRCPVRETTAARNLSLFRSLAIFLFKRQAQSREGKESLPDFEHHVHRKPWRLIRRFTQRRHEE